MNKTWKFTEHYIIDTCYLMNVKPLIPDLEMKMRKRINMTNNIRRQIPTSVIKEIQRNSNISDKRVLANSAKKAIASYDNNYTEVDNINPIRLRQAKIGVDSSVDLDVVSLAIDTAKKNPSDLVMVLSFDLGIQVELSNWKSCKNLFYLEKGRIIKYKKMVADKLHQYYKSFEPFWVAQEKNGEGDNINYPIVLDERTCAECLLKKYEPAKRDIWFKRLYCTDGEITC